MKNERVPDSSHMLQSSAEKGTQGPKGGDAGQIFEAYKRQVRPI